MVTGAHQYSPVPTTHPDKPISQILREAAEVVPFGQAQVAPCNNATTLGPSWRHQVSVQLDTELVWTHGLQADGT